MNKRSAVWPHVDNALQEFSLVRLHGLQLRLMRKLSSHVFIVLMNAVLLIMIYLFCFYTDDHDIQGHKNRSGLIFALFCHREGGVLTILCRSKEVLVDKVDILFWL